MSGRATATFLLLSLALGGAPRAHTEVEQEIVEAGLAPDSIARIESRLNSLLPPLFPATASVAELMREVPGNILNGLWDPRWQRLRLQPALAWKFAETRQEAELLVASLRAELSDGDPAVSEARLRLAELYWTLGEVVASGHITADVLDHTLRTGGEAPRALAAALIARARWLRRVGSYLEAQELLAEARAAAETASEDRAALLAALEEEVGATHLDRGDFATAETSLAQAVDLRAAIAANDQELLPVLARLAVARIALERDRFQATWEGPVAGGAKSTAPATAAGVTGNPSAALRDVLIRIADLTADSKRDLDALDRAWALSVLFAMSPGEWSDRASQALGVARTLISEINLEAAFRLRAMHVSSWSPELSSEVQRKYIGIPVARSPSAVTAPVTLLVEAEAARDRAERFLRFGELTSSGEHLRFVADTVAISFGPDHLETALAQAELAHQEWRSTGQLPEVAALLERAARQISAALGPRAVPSALALVDLAAIRSEMGSYLEATKAAMSARSILVAQLAPQSAQLARTLPRVAWALRESGALSEVKPTLLAAAVDESLSVCSLLHLNRNLMLADLSALEGELDAARELIRSELDRCRAKGALRENIAPLGKILSDRYVARTSPRDAVGLDDFYTRDRRRAKNAMLRTVGFVFFGYTGKDEDDDDDEEEWGEELWRDIGGLIGDDLLERAQLAPIIDPSRETDFYRVTGAVLRHEGLLREAAALQRGAIAGMEQGPATNHPKLADLHYDLAEVLWDASQRSSTRAQRRKDEKGSREAAQRSVEILDLFLRDSIAMLPERQALRLISNRPRPETILFSGLLYASDAKESWLVAAWSWALRMRSLVLDELALRHQHAIDAEDPETAEAWKEFVRARQRLAALWVRGPQVGYTYWPELKAAIAARERAEQALAQASAGFAAVTSQRLAGAEFVAGALPEGTALVEYLEVSVRRPEERTPTQRYVALTVDSSGHTGFADLGPAAEMDALVGDWLAWLRDTSPVGRVQPSPHPTGSPGEALRRKVWDPVVAKLGDVDLVFVVLDGALHQIQFAALPAASEGYLVEHGPSLHTLSTGRDLLRLQEPSRVKTEGLLALANPDFDAVTTSAASPSGEATYRSPQARCGNLARMRWGPLPASQREVEEIASMYREQGEVAIFTGAQATEERLKTEAPGKRYLHLATHGFFLNADCPTPDRPARGIGGLVVEDEDEPQLEELPPDEQALPAQDEGEAERVAQQVLPLVFGENPLLLSGLVLAGVHHARTIPSDVEDGIVTAEELAALDLRGLEIAALSACDTGLGAVAAGEGVLGLRRALEIAGARTVLMSLWQVPDETAKRWMAEFYRHVLAGEPVQSASRAASRASLDAVRAAGESDHPYLWAGFVAAGDWK